MGLVWCALYRVKYTHMFKLEPAKCQLWLECGEGARHWERLLKKARDHPFNHAVRNDVSICTLDFDILS